MGRKKKIELLEKPEPSKSLPNYEFEKRKWEAYNDLREGSSYRKAAAQHKISYRCLFDYARGKKNRVESHERYMALPVELETELSSRITAIVEESGVFPQQKLISQLANDLIRQNEASNKKDVDPLASAKSNTASSSNGSVTSPISPKPAVSDTWVSKFLRRHPELNYERRGKRRKTDPARALVNPNPALTPVIINTQYTYPNMPYRHLPSPHPVANPHYSQVSQIPPPVPSESHPYQPYHTNTNNTASTLYQHSQQQQQIQQQQQQQQPAQSQHSHYDYRNFSVANAPQTVVSAPPSIGSESNLANLATYPPKLNEDEYIYKCLNEWYSALNATMDTFSIQPSNVYNACGLNLTVDDDRGCILSRNIAARVSSSSSTTRHSTIPFLTNSAYGISIFECICSDGSTLPPAVISPTPLKSNEYHVLKCTSEYNKHNARIPRVARTNFFMWLKNHFEPSTRAKADNGKEWRVVITEETPSIDLLFFLWAFQRKILVVVIPARIAHATQPFDNGNIINGLRNKLVNSLTALLKQTDVEAKTDTVFIGTSYDDIVRRNSAPPTSNNSSGYARTGLVTTIFPASPLSLTKHVNVAQLMEIYMNARSLTDGIQEAWKSSGIVPRNAVLVMNSIGQAPIIEAEQYLIKFEHTHTPVPAAGSQPPKTDMFPSVSALERGIEIFHHEQLSAENKATLLFQLLESSFDRAVVRDLSQKRKRSSDDATLVNYDNDYDYDYDYEEAEQVLGYDQELLEDSHLGEVNIKQEQGASSPIHVVETASSSVHQDDAHSKAGMMFSISSDNDLSSKLRKYLHPSRTRSESSPMTIDQVTLIMKSSGFSI